MFLRIFRYRVKPQMRDRHLAVQARAARLYEQHVQHSPKYFRRSGDANSWVELHWYEDKAECQRVAATVADDLELTRLWRDFQETLDPDYPPSLEEFGEYELPPPVTASPFSQPPIDARQPPSMPQDAPPPRQEDSPPPAPTASPAAAEIAAEIVDEPAPAAPPESTREHRQIDDDATDHSADNGEAKRRERAVDVVENRDEDPAPGVDDEASKPQGETWPTPPLPNDNAHHNAHDDLIIEDDAPSEADNGNSLSFNDGVWIVEPDEKPRYPRDDDH